MTSYFFDASAIVKRYADESGSAWTRLVTGPTQGDSILLAEITLAEVAAALASKQRAPCGLTMDERDRALARFLQDCDELFLIVPSNRDIIDLAVELTQRHRLRGYDAVQLAAALVASRALQSSGHPPVSSVAADRDLLQAARSEGLPVDDPLDHSDLDQPTGASPLP